MHETTMTHYDAATDSANFFSFASLQVLHGPVDLKHPPLRGGGVTFRTSGTKHRGFMVAQLYTTRGEKSIVEIPFVHIERVLVLSSGRRPSVAIILSDFAAEHLTARLGTREKIVHVMRGLRESCDLASKTLIFVLRPYKDDLFVQHGDSVQPCYGGMDELCERLDVWVRFVRNKDLIAKEQRQAVKKSCAPILTNSANFFVRSTAQQWCELLRSIHLFENHGSDADMVPYRCRPPEPRPVHTPRLRIGKLFNRQHPSTAEEPDEASGLNTGFRISAQNICDDSHSPGCISDLSNNDHGENLDYRYLNDYQSVQSDAGKQYVTHIVPMQGRNFTRITPRSYAEDNEQFVVQQSPELVQSPQFYHVQQEALPLQPTHSQYVGDATTLGPALRNQHVILQSQQGSPVVYQVTPTGQQSSLFAQFVADSPKMDSRVVLVNQFNSDRLTSLGPEPVTFPPVKRVLRSSSRVKKEIETIAIDDDDDDDVDDDEMCETNASSSLKACEQGENGAVNRSGDEPPEKRPRKNEVLLVFPPVKSAAVPLHFEDLRVLAHGEMLNDSIIEFYLKYIHHKLVRQENRDKVFLFNTFFYKKLTDKQPSISILNKNYRSSIGRFEWIKRNFSHLKSWTKKVDIFSMDYIVLPINDEMHWYLVIIVKPSLAIVTQRSEDVEQARKRGSFRMNPDTFIVILDSLPDPHDVKRKCVLDILRDYLECELADKRGSTQEVYLDRTRIGALYPQCVPHQENYVDCGLYLLQFAEAFLTKPPTDEMLRQGIRWNELYPWFDHSMYFMREKIVMRIKGLCNAQAWRRLEAYERQQGRGVSIETASVIIDRARRPRRHSETRLHERHPRASKRTHSEPPNLRKCAPPAPRMVP
ncbi:hypothetical protein KIN20_023691 [Parelaphostrongylus tenuis]|uniref:Ubiquitin-like protease family profile domain-containing protein n=1 Tax=Parelaphostrongylus tenuis TaxID=148309 RepID=A0AAD5QVZ4_PARTN|nr:hypothetical protein KIN20_023691 [Parelaphostrongylus tenuis]